MQGVDGMPTPTGPLSTTKRRVWFVVGIYALVAAIFAPLVFIALASVIGCFFLVLWILAPSFPRVNEGE